MERTALLTDDEIVALCAAAGQPWPIGLPTVEPTSEELTRAGVRGMRSLLVRRLTGSDAEQPGFRPNQMIAEDVEAFLRATERIGIYVAPADNHDAIGGASISTGRTPDGWIIDTVTAAGVHALRAGTASEAAETVLTLAEAAYSGEAFAGDDPPDQWVCVIRFGPDAANHIVLSSGSATGVVDGDPVQDWDPALIRNAFGAPAA